MSTKHFMVAVDFDIMSLDPLFNNWQPIPKAEAAVAGDSTLMYRIVPFMNCTHRRFLLFGALIIRDFVITHVRIWPRNQLAHSLTFERLSQIDCKQFTCVRSLWEKNITTTWKFCILLTYIDMYMYAQHPLPSTEQTKQERQRGMHNTKAYPTIK